MGSLVQFILTVQLVGNSKCAMRGAQGTVVVLESRESRGSGWFVVGVLILITTAYPRQTE